jgi:hypothetical protein
MLALLQGHGVYATAHGLGEQDGYGLGPAGVWDHASLIGIDA